MSTTTADQVPLPPTPPVTSGVVIQSLPEGVYALVPHPGDAGWDLVQYDRARPQPQQAETTTDSGESWAERVNRINRTHFNQARRTA